MQTANHFEATRHNNTTHAQSLMPRALNKA